MDTEKYIIKIKSLFQIVFISAVFIFMNLSSSAQISPGELSKKHAYLEGISNCTQCHSLGNKVTNEKCLKCHTEIQSLITKKKGYHASSDVQGKECVSCHNEHHGRNFDLNRFDEKTFDHKKTGYALEGTHKKLECEACHQKEHIADAEIGKRDGTYLGMGTECLSCHKDYHQKTMSSNCAECHGQNSFKPAPGFNHNETNYKLVGAHQRVECIKCHNIGIKNGEKFQEFTGVKFDKCTNCHVDIHDGKFGDNCTSCHSEESFHKIKNGVNNFDHNKTNFKLLGKHQSVDCKSCHKTSYTASLKHDRCSDCHDDYHKGQFTEKGKVTDCDKCHNNNGFTPSLFTIDDHSKLKFKLEGSHIATSCLECHKKQGDWSFRKIGEQCVDCHENVHKATMSAEYNPNEKCETCHNVTNWENVTFDHNKTDFKLKGVHAQQKCRSCHYESPKDGTKRQQFATLSTNCVTCHEDIHLQQFDVNGKTDCEQCHEFENWEATKFDHNKLDFKLEKGHKDVACAECHKEVVTPKGNCIKYKFVDSKCIDCHK